MKDHKTQLIIETAIKLFAQKGYSSTSIQEIATECGISKGAFYLYFKSKESLLYSIFEDHFEMIFKKLVSFENMNLPPREKFTRQLAALVESLMKHKDFFIMQSREQAIPLNESIKELLYKTHLDSYQFYQKGIRAIYGPKVEPFLWDLSLTLEGMIQSFSKILFFDYHSLKISTLCETIIHRLDSIVDNIANDLPLITEEKVEIFLSKSKAFFLKDANKLENAIKKIKKVIEGMDTKEELSISLEVIETEINSKQPRIPVIQGMLSNFKEIPELESHIKMIQEFYNIK